MDRDVWVSGKRENSEWKWSEQGIIFASDLLWVDAGELVNETFNYSFLKYNENFKIANDEHQNISRAALCKLEGKMFIFEKRPYKRNNVIH